MRERSYALAALLAVVGVSIVFGMILGGRLNAPPTALAAPNSPDIKLAAAAGGPGVANFADIVDATLPAVVSVIATQTSPREDDDGPPSREDFFHWWFSPPDSEEFRRQAPQQPQPRIGEGSGFIISSEGYLLTNNHVVEDSDRVKVRLEDGREFSAEVVGTDPSIDLALLKVDTHGTPLPTLPLGDSNSVRVGEWVIAIGNPLEFEQTVTVGVISGKGRRVPIGATDAGVVSFIQTDAAINFGNSGGPLLDARGNVIGINTAIRRANFAEGIGFALPINHAVAVMDQLRERGYVRRGYLGITMNQNGIDEVAREYYGLPDRKGVIVDEVQPEGPAAAAGLKQGDVIRQVNGEPIDDNMDLISKIAAKQPGDRVRLEVFRAGKVLALEARLADRGEQLESRLGRPDEEIEPRDREPEPAESTGLGLTVENLTERMRRSLGLAADRQGVVVTEVEFDAEAYGKGIRPEMLIVSVNDRQTSDVAEWKSVLDDLRPGKPVKLAVVIPQPQQQQSDGDRTVFVYLRAPE